MANLSKMNFPLFRLPILAIFKVLSTMNPFEIINFSMISMKCKKIVKIFFRSGCKFEVFLHIFANPTISIKGTQSYYAYKFTTEKKEHNILKYHKEDEDDKAYETLMKYSTNVVESSLNLFNYIDDLINFKNLSLLSFEMCHFPRQNDLITQKIRNIRKSIEWFHVYSKEDVGNDVTDLLNHVKGIKSLDLSVPFSKDFEMICPPSLHLLQITNSKWVDLKKLLEFNSSEIALRDSELTDSELCAFFQSWMSSESHLNLVKFEISPAKRETFTIISQSLPHEEIDDGVVRKIHILQTWETLLEWFNIKRNDGTWATIYLTQHAMYPNRLTLGMVVG